MKFFQGGAPGRVLVSRCETKSLTPEQILDVKISFAQILIRE